MKRTAAMIVLAGVLGACGGKHSSQQNHNPGYMTISLALVPSDVTSVVATVTGAAITTPITQALAISGSPATATGTINPVPDGSVTVTVNGFPAAPDNAIAIYTGTATTTVTAGQLSNVSITLQPVNADVTVNATYPAGDIDIPNIDHTAVVVSGARVNAGLTYYLTLNAGAGTASGTASAIPVGSARTFTLSSYNAAGTLLFSGTGTISVATGSNSVSVTMTNQTGAGAVSVNGSFCSPSCGTAVCGSDGCGGSCGGCEPGATCTAGQCPTPAAAMPLDFAHWEYCYPTAQSSSVYAIDDSGTSGQVTLTGGDFIINTVYPRTGGDLVTIGTYAVAGRTLRLRYQGNNNGSYMTMEPKLIPGTATLPDESGDEIYLSHTSLGNSFLGSTLISANTWYYTRATFTSTTFSAVTASGAYDDEGGTAVQTQTGTLPGAATYYIGVRFGDPYVVGDTITLAEASLQ